ncbi:MAG: SH3 domain-containing protein [Chryseobacterium sp.]|nr:MAG: SH3 domain-containing protein [Chryseobacterium sp.]
MSLQEKYAEVVNAAKSAGVDNLSVQEQNGILYVSGSTNSSSVKDKVWDALGRVDPNYSASDINLDIQVSGLAAGANLTVNTESSNLNVRQSPNTEAAIVGKAGKGEMVTLVEQTNAEWWLIKTKDGVQGYAYSRYLRA